MSDSTITNVNMILVTKFEVPAIGLQPDATFEALGLDDSLALVELSVAIEREFAVRLEVGQLFAAQTVAEAVALIDATVAELARQ